MAALAPSRSPLPVQQLTPPSSSHGAGASWDFAVPLDGSRQSYDQESFMSGHAAPAYAHANRQPHTSQANNFAKPVRSTTWESHGQYEDDRANQASGRASSLHKKPSRDMMAGDQDSTYAKSSTKGKMGPPASVRGRGAKKSAGGSPVDPETDQSKWIHRDKLKEIEIREMEEAGFRVGRTSRSNSRSQSATRRTRDRTNSELAEALQTGDERYERHMVSPIPAEDEDALAEQQYHTWSPTSSEGPAPDMQPPSSRTNHTVRPSTSRIPLPKTSGIPVPASLADRDAPLPRSRTGSANWNGDIAAAGARVRSGSIGSQVLLDDFMDERKHGHIRNNSSSASASSLKHPPKSPMKAKTPGKPAAAGARKTSTTSRTQSKSRQVSGTNRRPATGGNVVSRPTTGHRPEGEAPWIATMYKPDPRLPPDQQIIPTHAKRMQQEQWENEGRVGSMYDTDFRLLNTDETGGQRLSQIDPIALEKERQNEQWPLPSPDKHADEKTEPSADKSPAVEQPQFKLTPTIPQSPRALSPKPASLKRAPSEKPKTTRMPEPNEDVPEKKGKCCIVM
ncbi:40S ribosomal protein S12 [Ascochyta clinopodiicola]|nr:40S ribosomal protein S12 [Ascochyta clinopodiicola]